MATTLSISPAAAANEGNSGAKFFTFNINRAGTLTGTSSAFWVVAGTGNSPASASDFVGGVLPNGVVSFATGQSTATVTVDVNGDTVGENDEGFSVTLYNPVGATLGTSNVGTSLNQSASGGYGVTENFYNISGGAGAFTLSYDMYSIPDEAQIFVNGQLAVKTNGQVSDFGILSIPATYSLKSGDVIKVVMIGTDFDTAWDYTVNYTGGIQTIDYIASSFIINDDGPVLAPTSTLSIEQPAPLNEGNSGPTPMGFMVKRTGDISAAASAQWSVNGTGNAPANGSDFVGGAYPNGVVNFAPGQSIVTLTVNVNGDTTPESNETFTVTLSNPAGVAIASGVILNDDTPSKVSKFDDFLVLQSASSAVVGAGIGNDVYLISQHMLPAGIDLTISDVIDSNSIQLNNGLKIASFQIASNALKLTLDSGASVTVLGADKFTYDPGANSTVGVDNIDLSYTSFVNSILGKTVPTSGTVSGGPITIGSPLSPSGSTSPISGNGTFNATSAADVFYFNAVTALLDALGTNTQVKVSGFNTTFDSFQIDLPTSSPSITKLSQLNGQQGVAIQVDPISGSIVINFGSDANGGQVTSLTLVGVIDPSLIQITVI